MATAILDAPEAVVREPAVSVVIPARDAASTIGRTLAALANQVLGDPFELIVVDDGSADETAAIVRGFEPLVRLVRNERSEGAGAARNRGARAARSDVLAFTDADCFPTEQWLSRALEAIVKADLVQGAVRPDPDVPRTPFDRTLVVDGLGGFYQTANLIVRREVFDAVGGFRDWSRAPLSVRLRVPGPRSQRPVGEDTVFGWAACRHGAREVFAPEAVVHHVVEPGTVRTAVADRWHWATLMPGLARLVPELRDRAFFGRWFFSYWTAQFDLAVAGLVISVARHQRRWLVATLPYLRRLGREARLYRDGRDTRSGGAQRAISFVLGSPVVDAATVAGLVAGSIYWRRVVL